MIPELRQAILLALECRNDWDIPAGGVKVRNKCTGETGRLVLLLRKDGDSYEQWWDRDEWERIECAG